MALTAENSSRTAVGRPFQKGQSGNPGGRPKEDPELKELARAHTAEAIATLVAIMTGQRSPASARVAAANALLDRGYGKPQQSVELGGELGIRGKLVIRD